MSDPNNPHRAAHKGSAALRLKLSGATDEEIRTALGYKSTKMVQRHVESELAKGLTASERDAHRDLTRMRYERMLRALWNKATDPANPEQIQAVREARGILSSISKLYGLDAPVEVTVHSPTTEELERWVAGVLAQGVPEVIEADIVGELVGEVDEDAVAP